MLVIKLEFWPGGDQRQSFAVGQMEIRNISDLAPVSDYEVRLGGVVTQVRGHERDRGAWELVRRAIQSFQDAIR